jgi:hypothetical protein
MLLLCKKKESHFKDYARKPRINYNILQSTLFKLIHNNN